MAKLNEDADVELAPGTVIDGRYRVIRSIGQGGNGLVYEVEHARTGRRLALKALLDETGFGRLEQEARAASLMKNGHTARIIDMEPQSSSGPYMVMELLEGQSLRALLDEAGQLPLELTVNMAMQVCECLQEAHGLGIIHRDLKPENVYLCPSQWPGQYDVKVLDFGVMKIAADGGVIPKSSLTRTGSTVGTPYYMSLEQLRNSSAVDARADVYSLGVVLYECLSGRKPFQADTIGDLVYALCSGPPTPLTRLRPDLPQDVCDIITRTLSANRDDRPATMLDLAAALLPHASPAFALWVKIDGRQPALAARGPGSAGYAPSYGQSSMTPAPQAIAGDQQYPTAPPPKASQPGYPAPPIAAGEPIAPTNQAWPPPVDTGRRDTPTEMYVKGVHGGPSPMADELSHAGDRDTPTRAYEAIPGRPPLLETMKSPVGVGALGFDGSGGGADDADVKTLDLEGRNKQQPPLTFNAPKDLSAPSGALMTMPLGKVAAPIPVLRVAPGAPPLAQHAPTATPMPAGLPKPAWQVTLDRWLITVGRLAEDMIRRFRAAPQNTQIIVIIVSVTGMLLFLGLLVFLLAR